MAISPAVIDAMVAAGCTAEQLGAAMKADMAEQDARKTARRANNAERQRRFKSRQRGEVTGDNAGNALPGVIPLDKETPPTPPKEIKPTPPIVPPKRKKSGNSSAKPEDVGQQVWDDWIDLRRRKRAPVTDGVVASARAEAAQLGWPLEKFFAEWIFRGSQGLKAEWITKGAAPQSSGDSFLAHVIERQRREEQQRQAAGP